MPKLVRNGLERREIHLPPAIVKKLIKKAEKKQIKLKPYLEQLAINDANNEKSNGADFVEQ